MKSDYVATIGLEVHVQLKTKSKMFCGCAVEYGSEPNIHVCPICLGLPGALPAMNLQALKMTALTGLIFKCDLAPICKFDRKNYFYPDMPKNYQISQYDAPLCHQGEVPLYDMAYPKDAQKNIRHPNKRIRLVRIHLEEDVAKSFHFGTTTGIDFNRAGTPLMEIVSEPDIESPEEAFAYLSSLKQALIYGGVSDADMEKGQLRCDCNVSVRKHEETRFGTKIELKNLNSISGIRRALAYEIDRQIEAVDRGETLQQETRRWDDDLGKTSLMRTKESEHDYRYFPDPDLLPVKIGVFMEEVRALLPELPWEKRERFVREYGISEYDAGVLADDRELSAYFEAAAKGAQKPKAIANYVLNDLLSALGAANQPVAGCPIPPNHLKELVDLVDGGKISSKQGKDVFAEMFATGKAPGLIVEEKGLKQESDIGAIESLCDEVIAAHPKSVEDYKAGKVAAINFLKGQVMRLSKGKANPNLVGEVLVRLLS
ncbi:MAG TPA: Asp-tRNA(Asn)/Glu-tRNA(Gln) amidotransferase subunit GatB [Chthoniobacterales bacterium]|jgi:aspartyl-tRNA(Asn)/glutamyl-tRNA(Gln) amidotransferase subunit B|nr:Asp-tRNA(Asn)/Glu-tRNA(Gln) amidotransferase subunit GatB [Chthoniobacterales bacterium]